MSEVNHRLVEIANGAAERLVRKVHEKESDKETCIIGLDWSFPLEDLIEIVQVCVTIYHPLAFYDQHIKLTYVIVLRRRSSVNHLQSGKLPLTIPPSLFHHIPLPGRSHISSSSHAYNPTANFPPKTFLRMAGNTTNPLSQLAQEYSQRTGGLPDLFLWHPQDKTVLFAEVKSEKDRLSDTQRLWIHVLTGAGVKVELCNAVAREVRVVAE